MEICLHVYLKCEGGGAELWPLPTARVARVLEGGSCRASQMRMTRMRTKARTEKAKAAVPKVTPVAGRQENTPNTTLSSLLLLPSVLILSHMFALTSCLTNFKLLAAKLGLLALQEVAREHYPNILLLCTCNMCLDKIGLEASMCCS